jgi:hypothetical protein
MIAQTVPCTDRWKSRSRVVWSALWDTSWCLATTRHIDSVYFFKKKEKKRKIDPRLNVEIEAAHGGN